MLSDHVKSLGAWGRLQHFGTPLDSHYNLKNLLTPIFPASLDNHVNPEDVKFTDL